MWIQPGCEDRDVEGAPQPAEGASAWASNPLLRITAPAGRGLGWHDNTGLNYCSLSTASSSSSAPAPANVPLPAPGVNLPVPVSHAGRAQHCDKWRLGSPEVHIMTGSHDSSKLRSTSELSLPGSGRSLAWEPDIQGPLEREDDSSEGRSRKMARRCALSAAAVVLIGALVAGCLAAVSHARSLRDHGATPQLIGGDEVGDTERQDQLSAMAAEAVAGGTGGLSEYRPLPGEGCTGNTLMRFEGVADETDCAAICSAEPSCGAYTYSTAGDDKCYLKQNCNKTKSKSTNDSGVKIPAAGATEDGNDPSIGGNFLTESQPNTEGGANGGQQLDGAAESDAPRPPGDFVVYANMACADSSFWSVEHTGAYAFPWQCRRHCANHPACRAYTWDASASRCSLASSCEKRVVAEGATSGVDAPTDSGYDPNMDRPAEGDEGGEAGTEANGLEEKGDNLGRFTLFTDTECVVDNVLERRRDVPTVEACREACEALPDCGGFTYNPDRERCYLVADCSERSSEGGNTSGTKPAHADGGQREETVPDSDTGTEGINEGDETEGGEADSPSEDNADADFDEGSQQQGQPAEPATAAPTPKAEQDDEPVQPPFRATTAPPEAEQQDEPEEPPFRVKFGDVDSSRYNLYERTGCKGSSLVARSGYGTVADCQAWCDERDGCAAFTLNAERGRCYLKADCDEREVEPTNVSGIKKTADTCAVRATCDADMPNTLCPEITATKGEMADAVAGAFEPPYAGITYSPTFDKREEYPTCNFEPPRDPLPADWVEQCIENARGVGFLEEDKGRPNEECPAGWFLCKGMCYTLVQRNNRGPQRGSDYYDDDFMFVESRCNLCGGARVAFVGDDPEMQRVAAEAANQTLNEDKATWVRRFRFLEKRNPLVENGTPFQPWHLYLDMYDDDKRKATYQRYYTGEKDNLDSPGWDRRFRNQEASILCVNTVQRIQQAVKHPKDSNLTMKSGCRGKDKDDMWDNDEHRWRPAKHYPFPGH